MITRLLTHMGHTIVVYADYGRFAAMAPRIWLLDRAHVRHPWWVMVLALAGACTVVGYSLPTWLVAAVLVLVSPGIVLDTTGAVLHALWKAGPLWQDLACPRCDGGDDGGRGDGGPGDDGDDGPHPQGPEQGLTEADLRILDAISCGVVDVAGRDGGRC